MNTKKTSKYVAPPLSEKEKEKMRNWFINSAKVANVNEDTKVSLDENQFEIKQVNLRLPRHYLDKINELKKITGMNMNAILLEIIRVGLQNKLTEIKAYIE